MGPMTPQSYADREEGLARIRELISETERPPTPAVVENRAERRARLRKARRRP